MFRRIFCLCATVLCLAAVSGCEMFAPAPKTMQASPGNAAIEARWTLLKSADDKDIFTRAEAVEALGLTIGADCGNTYIQALQDESAVVRLAAAMTVGDLKYEPAKPLLLKMANHEFEPDKGVFAGVVYALYRMGDKEHAHELLSLLFDTNEDIRAEAALVMGKMGHPSGVAPLSALRNMEMKQQKHPLVEIQVKESLAMLGDAGSIDSLEGNARGSIFLDERVAAVRALGAIRDHRALYLLPDMIRSSEPVFVRLAAAGALAQLGRVNQEGYELCVRAVQDPVGVLREGYGPKAPIKPEDASKVATIAAISLGYMGNSAAVDVLLPLLKSVDGAARVAAAKSILLLLPAYLKIEAPAPKPATTSPAVAPKPPVTTAPVVKPVTTHPKLVTSGAKD